VTQRTEGRLQRRLDDAERRVRRSTDNRILRGVARSGYLASGLLRVLIGWLALLLAAHVAGPRPGTSGAFSLLAAVPGGVVLLALVAAANLALLAWLIVQGLLHQDSNRLEQWRQRSVYWGRGVVYGVIGLTAAGFALGAQQRGASGERAAGRQLLEVPGGAVVLGLAGIVVVIIGASMMWIGLAFRFVRTIRLPDAPAQRFAVLLLGVVGYAAMGGTIVVVGGFLAVAALTSDVSRVGGLDAALEAFTTGAFGRAVLVAIGAGWIVAGVYALLRARLARLD
jgi:Domain of Unknown Function (DUF1206)